MQHSFAAQMAATCHECATHFLFCALPVLLTLSGALDQLCTKQVVMGSSSKLKIQETSADDDNDKMKIATVC